MSIPTFVTYRDRRSMLDRCLDSLFERGFDDITVIDNDSQFPLEDSSDYKVVHSDNSYRQLSPWELGLVPNDSYYQVLDCDVELDCPDDVESVLIDALEAYPEIEKIGLGIRTDDLLHPPPAHYQYSYLHEYAVANRIAFPEIAPGIIAAPIDTHHSVHRPGHGWGGITGARTTAPYLCRHLSWYNAEYTSEERLYYDRAGEDWIHGHSASSLLEMTVAVPFTELRQETVVALHGEEVRYAPMIDDESYWQLLSDLWRIGNSFTIVEHDIVVGEGTLDELAACPYDWCAMAYPYRDDTAYGLACTKFSRQLIARHPDLMDIVAKMSDETHPPKHWCRMCAWLSLVLGRLGEVRHEHSEMVGHVGAQYPRHGCLLER